MARAKRWEPSDYDKWHARHGATPKLNGAKLRRAFLALQEPVYVGAVAGPWAMVHGVKAPSGSAVMPVRKAKRGLLRIGFRATTTADGCLYATPIGMQP